MSKGLSRAADVERALASIATEVADGRATSVNETCNLPCANALCDTTTCPPCEVNDGCNDPSLRGVHPELCKCTSATGCGVTSENVCTVPTWAEDPPTIAVGMAAWHFSQPTEVKVDHAQSTLDVSVFVDATDPCGSDTDTASPRVRGTITLFGTPCPGESCELLLDAQLSVDNFELDFDFGFPCGGGSVDVSAGTLSVGGEGIHVELGPDGCGTIAAGDLRVSAGALLNVDGDTERKKYDSTNTEAFSLCVDFENNTFEIPTANLSLTDGSASLSVVGEIVNQPPLADAGPDQLVECSETGGAAITLDGTASFDPDGSADIRAYTWWRDSPLVEENLVDFGSTVSTVAALGSTSYFLTLSDLRFITMASRVEVGVEDTTPPELTVDVVPNSIWPPDHKLVQVTANVGVSDICDDAASFVLTSITSNEPDNGTGDGDTVDDIQGADFGTPDTEFFLRRERKGNGSGRVYTVTYTATDASGNSNTVSDQVMVAHDQRKK